MAATKLAWTVVLVTLASTGYADRLVTTDGRILEVVKAREEGDGYRLVFRNGEILVGKDHVKSVEIEGDMSEYVPRDEDEKQKLEQGYVKYDGKWMSKPAYENLLAKQAEENRERTEELALHASFSNAYELETRHFHIFTNTSPELLEQYGDLLETYYKLMDKRIGIDPTPTMKRKKMRVNIYKSHKDFKSHTDASDGVLGFFRPFQEDLNFFHDYQEPGRSEWVALHECTHLLTFLIDQDYIPQIWLNEAVADYFGSSEVVRDRKGRLSIEPGRIQTDRVLTVQQAIADGKDIGLADLFLIERDSFHGFEYAHAWSFVYFLTSDKKYARAFDRFFKDLYTRKAKDIDFTVQGYPGKSGTGYVAEPAGIRDALLKRLGVKDVDALDRDWKDFIAAIPIDAPEARFKRGYTAVKWGQIFSGQAAMQAARDDIDAALDAGITDPRAYSARGWLDVYQGNFADAVPDFRMAVEAAPLNAAYRFDLAFALSKFFGALGAKPEEGSFKPLGSEAEIAEASMHFGLSTELDPGNDRYRETFDAFQEARR